VFESKILTRIFRPKREEMIGGWRKLHNEEFHNLYSSLLLIRVIKLGRMRWGYHVVYMGDVKTEFGLSVGNLK
jgi:hypothetical protein